MIVFDDLDIAQLAEPEVRAEYESVLVDALRSKAPGLPIGSEDITYLDNGLQKIVYRVRGALIERAGLGRASEDVVAVATPFIDGPMRGSSLFREYEILHELRERVDGHHTPNPIFYTDVYSDRSRTRTQLLGMELLPGITHGAYVESASADKLEALVTEQATVAGEILKQSGFVHAEPHSKNLLVESDGCVRFIDAIHFFKGSSEDLYDIWLDAYASYHPELRSRTSQRRFIDTVERIMFEPRETSVR